VRTDITYDAMGNIASIQTGSLAETRYEYDLNSNLIRAIAVDGGEEFATLFAYDANGNLISVTDPNGNVTTHTHDPLNRISTITNAVGGVFHITYDALGRVSQIIDEEGAQTSYFYDRTGLLVRIQDALGNSRTFTHDALGRITSETDENGVTRYFEYDLQGNLIRFVNGEGQDWLYTYDELGRMLMVRGPLPTRHTTRYEYDVLGRVTRRIDDHGHIRTFAYDALSRITSVTDELGNVTRYFYDGVGNVIEVIDPMGNSIHYEYDGLNRLVRVNAEWHNPITGASGFQQTIYQFNGRGLLVTEINALGAERTHEYDAAGNAIITIDEDGNVINREFNPLNLVSAVTTDDVLLGFVYDKTGRLVSMTDATGETNFLLDPLYRIIEVRDSFGRVTEYAYDPVGNLTRVIYPDASEVIYTHNRNNQVLTIQDPDGGITRNVYDSYGRLARQYLPNGAHTEFSYNTLNQLTQSREIFNARTTRQFSYGYTDNGMLHTETIQFFGIDAENTNRMFIYDANGRLFTSNDTLLGRTDYDYDSLGNLIRVNQAGAVTTYTHNAMNQLLTRTGPDGHFVYTYDNRGNLINESRDGVTIRAFEFDALGRMVRGTNELGETSEFEYNALGLRVANTQRILPGHMGGQGWDVNGYLTDEANSPGSRHINVNRMSLAELPTSVWFDSLDGYRWRDGWQDELPDDIPESAHQRTFKDNFGLNRNSGVVRQEFVIDYAMGFNQDLMVVEEGGFSTVFVYGTPLQRLSQHTTKADSIVSGVPVAGGALDPGGNVAADIAVVPTYRVLYYRLDFRNSTSQMQLPNGQYIAWSGYDQWGSPTSPTDHDMNMAGVQDSVRFTSYTFDRILGLYYAQHRWYDANQRRFISPDPHWRTGISGGNMVFGDVLVRMPGAGLLPDIWVILQSTNLYAYCANNPVNFIDPRGLQLQDGYFMAAGCDYIALAQNRYAQYLGITTADLWDFLNNATNADLNFISSLLTMRVTDFDSISIAYMFRHHGRAESERILEEFGRHELELLLIGLAFHVAPQGYSLVDLDRERWDQLGEDISKALSLALGAAGQALGSRIFHGPPPGSFTTTPPPVQESENVQLTRAQQRNVRTLDNVINNNLTESDFSGTLRDLQGDPVPNRSGGFWDHRTEMVQSHSSLQGVRSGLEGSLRNPNLDPAVRDFLQSELNRANSYIDMIEDLFRPFGGVR